MVYPIKCQIHPHLKTVSCWLFRELVIFYRFYWFLLAKNTRWSGAWHVYTVYCMVAVSHIFAILQNIHNLDTEQNKRLRMLTPFG